MVKRKGIGATSASAVIFSVILVSNLALYVSSQGRATLYSRANAEDSVSDGAAALAGAGGANVLDQAQTFLASGTLDCASAEGVVASEMALLSDEQRTGNLTVTTSARIASGEATFDNLSMLDPFNGSIHGDLGLALRVVVSGEVSGAGVSISKVETHFVHLPVHLENAVSDCLAAVDATTNALSNMVPVNCTASVVGPLMLSASQAQAVRASSDGFVFGLDYFISGTAPCSVGFRVSVEQEGIQGPGGEFSLVIRAEGSASFGQRASPQPA